MSLTFKKATDAFVLLWSGSRYTGQHSIASGYSFSDFASLIIEGGHSTNTRRRFSVTVPYNRLVDTPVSPFLFHTDTDGIIYAGVEYDSETTFTVYGGPNPNWVITAIYGVY